MWLVMDHRLDSKVLTSYGSTFDLDPTIVPIVTQAILIVNKTKLDVEFSAT